MSAFQVGDRVKYDGPVNGANSGTVTGIDGVLATVRWDDGISLVYGVSVLSPLAPVPAVSVAPTLETATGADLDRIARDMLKVYRVPGTPDADFRSDLLEMAPRGRPVKCGDFQIQVYDVDRPPLSPIGNVTKAECSDAQAQLDSMRAALDKVRVFFASHRFDSLGVAAGRELREAMAVVLAALDAERAGK